MKNNTKFIFMPEYMTKFKCDGVNCEETCCAGWGISIDEDTFNRYTNTKNNGFKKLLEHKIVENRNKTFLNYGSMIITENIKCPFLNESSLCDIHGGFGEKELCITCYNYPRIFNIIDEVYEKSALMSCPVAANLALLNKEKMDFVEGEDSIYDNKVEVRRIFDLESMSCEYTLLEYFWEIRVLSINILQNRNYSIDERLNILEMLYGELQQEEISDAIDRYEEKNENNKFEKLRTCSCELNNESLRCLCKDEFMNLIKSERFLEVICKYKKTLIECNDKNKSIYNICNEMNAVDYIIENYIVNYFFTKIMPFNNLDSIECSVKNLVKHYNIIKAYILGICNGNAVGENEVVKVIQCFSRCIEHNVEATEYINKYI